MDLHEKILDVLGAVEVQHCPVLTDIKDYPRAASGWSRVRSAASTTFTPPGG